MLSKRIIRLFDPGSIAVLLLSAILLYLEYCLSDGLLSNDGYKYVLFAQEVVEKGFDQAYLDNKDMIQYPPLLIVLMVFGNKCGLDLMTAGRCVNILGTILTCQGVWFVSRKLYRDTTVAICSSLIVCSIPKMLFEGCGVLRDPLYWCEEIWIMYLLFQYHDEVKANKQKMLLLFLTLLTSLLIITRKEGIFFCILCWTCVIFMSIIQKKFSWAIILANVVSISAGIFIYKLFAPDYLSAFQ